MRQMHIKLASQDWRVKFRKNLKSAAGEPVMGLTDYTTNTIWINSDYSDEEQRSTLLHEVIHVGYAYYGIEVKGRDESVFGFERYLYSFLKDNHGHPLLPR